MIPNPKLELKRSIIIAQLRESFTKILQYVYDTYCFKTEEGIPYNMCRQAFNRWLMFNVSIKNIDSTDPLLPDYDSNLDILIDDVISCIPIALSENLSVEHKNCSQWHFDFTLYSRAIGWFDDTFQTEHSIPSQAEVIPTTCSICLELVSRCLCFNTREACACFGQLRRLQRGFRVKLEIQNDILNIINRDLISLIPKEPIRREESSHQHVTMDKVEDGVIILTFENECLSITNEQMDRLWYLYTVKNSDYTNFLDVTFCLITRYNVLIGIDETLVGNNQLNGHGFHYALPESVFSSIEYNFGSQIIECFASPINAYSDCYFSIFPDLECDYFSSMGSFFNTTLKDDSVYEVNPPFETNIIKMAWNRISHQLASSSNITFIVILPLWRECQIIEDYKSLANDYIEIDSESHVYVDHFKHYYVTPAGRTLVLLISSDKKRKRNGVLNSIYRTWFKS